MAGGSDSYHEPIEELSKETRLMHQAIVSVQEEFEAVDWYRQRADACADDELREILLHNMREELEHACMTLEWLRRNNADFQEQMSTYLFTDGPILEAEAHATGKSGGGATGSGEFTVGDMKDE